jgi:hypothetical protein
VVLVKRRPKVSVLVPRRVCPGDQLEVLFELTVSKPVPIDFMDVQLRGRIHVASGEERGFVNVGRPFVLGARLLDAGTLEAGKRRHSCRFVLPIDAPPSFRGRVVDASYELAVRVSIPWWPDVNRAFELDVRPRPPAGPREVTPVIVSSAVEGPREREPHAEVSLADSVLVPGEVLSGAVALGNVASARYTGVQVAFLGWECARGLDPHPLAGFRLEFPLREPKEGDPIPFRLRVPDATPTYRSSVFSVEWTLEVRVTRRLGADLVINIPLTILPKSTREAVGSTVRAPPTVGNERVQRVWTEVATRVGMRFADGRLVARVGEVDVHVRRDLRDGRPVLVAELEFPSLGLLLDAAPSGGLRGLFASDGLPFGKHARLRGRDPRQVRALAAALELAVGSAAVKRFDDRGLVLERPGAGLTAEPVATIAGSSLALAALLPKAARALPTPSGVDAEPWQALASSLGGQLSPAEPSLVAERDGRRIEVRQSWAPGGDPTNVVLSVWSLGTVPARIVADATSYPAEVRGLVELWRGRGAELMVAEDRATLELPGPLASAQPVLDAAQDLVEVVEALTRRGAYR